MKNSLVSKGLVLGIIVLLVGIALEPCITAIKEIDGKKELNNNLVEITIEIDSREYKAMLTLAHVMDLEKLIDSMKVKLDAAKTMEETSHIFDDTVVSLYELGMLPYGVNIEDAQRLVNGQHRFKGISKILYGWYNRNLGNIDNKNYLCLIGGYTNVTNFIGPTNKLLWFLEGIIPSILDGVLLFLELLNIGFWFLNPLPIGYLISLGTFKIYDVGGRYIPASGWVHSIGMNGIKNWNGSFFGNLSPPPTFEGLYPGILGFTGIKISNPLKSSLYIGTALWVEIGVL